MLHDQIHKALRCTNADQDACASFRNVPQTAVTGCIATHYQEFLHPEYRRCPPK